ncbi:probable glutamine--tRNA ligase [Phymastichus coffea]|uniref:probable glutamine--tRNA ligase n=1 Tax=Phymastichus coffea TaxID=108790 RepID=UPI00273C655C|nr:probable glutamine--tRNA ligase [Phymastichus coffea]
MEDNMKLLLSIGLSEQKAKETLHNAHLTNNVKQIINEVVKHAKVESINGTLLYHLACKMKSQILNRIPFIVPYIVNKKLDNVQRVNAALDYFLINIKEKVDVKAFENSCGIGVVITPEEIESEVDKCIQKYKVEILEKRYRYNFGHLMQEVRNALKWADGKMIKNEIDIQLFDLLGPKNENDNIPVAKQSIKSVKSNKAEIKSVVTEAKKKVESISINELIKSKIHFHKPGENFKTDGYILTPNTRNLIKEHLAITGGKVITRFPPEPNGILHIGHAKAININFGYAAAYNGICYLRYDDTNPEKEEEKFFTGILDMVTWLGYKPAKVTYSSDYFDQLYEWAIQLIKKDLAYVCHQTSDEIKGFNPPPSPWRNRPVSESLKLFQDMKDGLLNEGEATLRMKVTLEEGKQDPVAYRIKFSPHHRTKDKWCIYPTYDYTHCLCDSIENITHSLCTKEFQSRRSSYYWLCNALDIYCPVQWEYGRLNISYTVLSKRKIAKLIEKKIVDNWDDPRLFTLTALRRRGFPPEAINNFCAQMGVTGAQTTVDPATLEAAVRDRLNVTAPRHMVVIEPLKLTIVNFPQEKSVRLEVLDFPGEQDKGKHYVTFDNVIYIDSSDFKEEADKNFKRLTLKQSVGLKYVGVVLTVEEIKRDIDHKITDIIVRQESLTDKNKPKAFVQWVSRPAVARVFMYDKLFHHCNPEDVNEVPKGFLSDVNLNSKIDAIAYIDQEFKSSLKPYTQFQFERIGFFSVDPSSTPDDVIFNRTVTLKENITKA